MGRAEASRNGGALGVLGFRAFSVFIFCSLASWASHGPLHLTNLNLLFLRSNNLFIININIQL